MDRELATMRAEVEVLRNALRTERARSDLLWQMAWRRGFVTDEDYALSSSEPSRT